VAADLVRAEIILVLTMHPPADFFGALVLFLGGMSQLYM